MRCGGAGGARRAASYRAWSIVVAFKRHAPFEHQWTFGGPRSSFAVARGELIRGGAELQAQHHAHLEPNEWPTAHAAAAAAAAASGAPQLPRGVFRMLVYDNGGGSRWSRADNVSVDSNFSRAMEWELDVRAVSHNVKQGEVGTLRARLIWQFVTDFSQDRGSVYRIPMDGNGSTGDGGGGGGGSTASGGGGGEGGGGDDRGGGGGDGGGGGGGASSPSPHTLIGCPHCADHAGALIEVDASGAEVGRLALPRSVVVEGGEFSPFYRALPLSGGLAGERPISDAATAAALFAPSVAPAPSAGDNSATTASSEPSVAPAPSMGDESATTPPPEQSAAPAPSVGDDSVTTASSEPSVAPAPSMGDESATTPPPEQSAAPAPSVGDDSATTASSEPSAAPDIAAEDQRAKVVAISIALAGGALVVVGMLAKEAWDRGGATGGGGGRAPPISSSSSVDTPPRREDAKRRQAHGGGPPFGMGGAIEMSSRLGYETVCCVEEGQVANG